MESFPTNDGQVIAYRDSGLDDADADKLQKPWLILVSFTWAYAPIFLCLFCITS